MNPYEIRLKDGVIPHVVIHAPSMEATPYTWATRLRWAWRCLRGKSIDLNPAVMIEGCTFLPPDGFVGIELSREPS